MKKLSIKHLITIAILAILLSACTGLSETTESTVANLVEPVSETAVDTAPVPVTNKTETAVAANDDVVTQQTYINLYERVNPSVVNIQVLTNGDPISFAPEDLPEGHPDLEEPDGFKLPDGFELPDGFSLPDGFELPEGFVIPDNPDEFQPSPSGGQGSGFVYDANGHIITNNHVVDGADKITVFFPDGTETSATVVGTDPDSDIAVIKVDPNAVVLHPVPLGDSDSVRVGQLVAAIGNPFGLDGSMTTGIVSGLGRLLPGGATSPNGARFSIPHIIQTDTAINPGNSGGPLLNLSGEVIGVNTAIESNRSFGVTPSFGGIGYVVPSNIVSRVVPQLIANGRVSHPWIGITGGPLSGNFAEAMGLDINQAGVLISEVIEGGPADKAGLQGSEEETTIDGFPAFIGGDIIVQINEQPITGIEELIGYLVTKTAVDETVTLTILRDGAQMEVELTLEARPK